MNSREYIDYISTNLRIDKSSIFNPSGTPLEEPWKLVMNGYLKILEKIISNWQIGNCFIYISNKITPNAKATLTETFGVIEIHIGLVLRWKELFLENPNISPPSDSDNSIDIRIEMFKVASLYTFYHELAHIIQFKGLNKLGITISEEYSRKELYLPIQHLQEFDADIFSSLCVADHIIQNRFIPIPIIVENEQYIGDIISLNILSIFQAILCFTDSVSDLYYNKKSHPHPSIRNLIVSSQLMTQLLQFVLSRSKDIEIEEAKIIKAVFNWSHSLFKFSEKFKHLEKIHSKNEMNLEMYRKEIQKEMEKQKWLATAKRDLISKNIITNYSY